MTTNTSKIPLALILLCTFIALALTGGALYQVLEKDPSQDSDIKELRTQIAEQVRAKTCSGGDQNACDRICIYMSLQDVPGSSCYGETLRENLPGTSPPDDMSSESATTPPDEAPVRGPRGPRGGRGDQGQEGDEGETTPVPAPAGQGEGQGDAPTQPPGCGTSVLGICVLP